MLKAAVTLIGIISIVILSSIFVPSAWAATSLPFSLQWGSYGLQTTGQFAYPQSADVDSSGNVYVTDQGNRRVEKFDNNGNFLFTWGTKGSGNGQFEDPLGIAISGDSIYIIDNDLSSVQKFDLTGKFVTQWGSRGSNNGQFLLPQGIAVDPSGDVYVVDTGNSRVQKFDSTGKFILTFGESGLGDGQFLSPRAIHADSQGNIYVSDSGNNRIEKFTQDGVFIQSYSVSSGVGLKTPLGLSTDKSGNIFVADNGNNRIVELDRDGHLLTSWGTQGKGPDFFDNPRGVAVDPAGNVFVVDTQNNRIQKFGSNPIDTQTLQSENQTQTIRVIDNQTPVLKIDPNDKKPPTITAPSDITIEATGMLTAVSIGQATATDDTGVESITNNAPQKFPIGTTMVTWTATDNGGNIAKAIQKIIVEDTTAPVLTAPQSITLEAKSPDHNSVDLGLPSVNDAVGVESVTNDAPPFFSIGKTTVTWTANDASGNIASAKQIVTIKDTMQPVIHAPADITQEATSTNSVVDLGNATVTDNGEIKSVTNDAPPFFSIGKTTVTWTAKDASGNSASAIQIITITDTTPPKITSPNNVIFEATSLHNNKVPIGNATATDNGEIKSVTNNATKTFSLGKTVILWTAKDTSGNISNATQTVDVVDTTAPKIIPPKGVKVEATSLHNNKVPIGNATATDIEPVTITNNAPKIFPIGKTNVIWTAKDTSGNISNATQTVDVVDTTAPKIIPPKNILVNATSATDNHVDTGNATISDTVKVVSLTNNAPSVFPFGNTTITWTVTDEAGNKATAIQIISIVDKTPPKLTIPSDIIINATALKTPVQLGKATATGIIDQSPKITNNATSPFPMGKTTVEWTAVDKFGNTKTLTQTVTVLACGKPQSEYNLIMGTSGNDILTGSMVSNLIIGLEGNDIIHAGHAGDCIIAGNGDNIIFGGGGSDVIKAGNGDNIIETGTGDTQIYVGNGTNIIKGSTGHNTCYLGSPSKDTVVNCESRLH